VPESDTWLTQWLCAPGSHTGLRHPPPIIGLKAMQPVAPGGLHSAQAVPAHQHGRHLQPGVGRPTLVCPGLGLGPGLTFCRTPHLGVSRVRVRAWVDFLSDAPPWCVRARRRGCRLPRRPLLGRLACLSALPGTLYSVTASVPADRATLHVPAAKVARHGSTWEPWVIAGQGNMPVS
jgi:hypothetical protein